MDKTGIANLALSNLGEARIQSLTEDSSRARACSARMDNVLESILRMHVWNSALERQLLVRGEEPVFGWNYSYRNSVINRIEHDKGILKIYAWNSGNQEVFIEDMSITIRTMANTRSSQ